jgi:hypothetical protein
MLFNGFLNDFNYFKVMTKKGPIFLKFSCVRSILIAHLKGLC